MKEFKVKEKNNNNNKNYKFNLSFSIYTKSMDFFKNEEFKKKKRINRISLQKYKIFTQNENQQQAQTSVHILEGLIFIFVVLLLLFCVTPTHRGEVTMMRARLNFKFQK